MVNTTEAPTLEQIGRTYMSSIHRLRSALSRELDAVQVGDPSTEGVPEAMLGMIDARQEYIKALAEASAR